MILRGKGPQKPDVAYDIVGIHSLLTYTDNTDQNVVRDTETPLLRSFSFFRKQKILDIITTRQSMN